jgi:hypothetical protein
LKIEEANHHGNIGWALYKTIEILGPLTNLISCLILTMVIVQVVKISRQVQTGGSIGAAKIKTDLLVTGSHIGVTLANTITQSLTIFDKSVT